MLRAIVFAVFYMAINALSLGRPARSSRLMVNNEALMEIESLMKVAKTSVVVDALETLKKELLSSNSSDTSHYYGLNSENLGKIRSAARMGDLQLLRSLVTKDNKGDPMLSSTEGDFMGLTPLHWAVAAASTKSHLECVQFLIDNGADLYKANRIGNNPFHYAASTKKPDCMKLLLKCSPDVINVRGELGQTALHMSAAKGDAEGVKLCLQYNADVNAEDENKDTPLHMAARKGSRDCFELLVNSGANLGAINDKGVKAGDEKEAELINASYD